MYLIDICVFLPCIYLWQISQIQTCLCVVIGPRFVSTSSAFMRSIASYPAGPHGRPAQNIKWGPHCRDSSTACRLCCLEPIHMVISCILHKQEHTSKYTKRNIKKCNSMHTGHTQHLLDETIYYHSKITSIYTHHNQTRNNTNHTQYKNNTTQTHSQTQETNHIQ